jgi:hypothetical protein
MKTRKEILNLTAVIYPDADSDWLVAHNPETGTTTQGALGCIGVKSKGLHWGQIETFYI